MRSMGGRNAVRRAPRGSASSTWCPRRVCDGLGVFMNTLCGLRGIRRTVGGLRPKSSPGSCLCSCYHDFILPL